MNVWAARIALFAYLVGGFLLPAMHHHGQAHKHGQSCQHDGSACSHAGQHSHHGISGGDSCEVVDIKLAESICGCGHDCCLVAEKSSDELISAQPARANSNVGQGNDAHECSGHCLLCTARTLVTTQIKFAQSPTDSAIRVDAFQIDSVNDLRFEFSPANLTRGPPSLS